ncbi:hypothetical protein IAU60_002236 [Kwoniella sp. DSM 27419]
MGAACCKPEAIDFEGEVNLFHFYLLRSVGKGAFGKIDHPFVVNMRYAFQDDENCFFVLDLMLGGDLRWAMTEEVVRFYVAELAMAIDYLHSKRIVHRDLKPDNILLDEKGHAHITDFNIAVHFSERRLLTGVAGSMAYMAPEVLTKHGMQAIRGFLERDPNRRLGYRPGGGGMDDIKAHPWFRNIDWDQMYNKESKRANFDATHELEELLLEENPLKARKRKEGQDLELLSPEMRMMEEHFRVFDYAKTQRRSYYHPASGVPQGQPSSSGTTATTVSNLSTKMVTRSDSADDRTGVVSKTGLDVEAQILDGGGMANMNGRGGFKSPHLDHDGQDGPDLRPSPSKGPTPLRQSSV